MRKKLKLNFERKYLWAEIKKKLSVSSSILETSSLKKQCFFPKEAQIINNPKGTAPGMIWEPKKGFTNTKVLWMERNVPTVETHW